MTASRIDGLIDEFLTKAQNFNGDLSLPDIDSKHSNVISHAHTLKNLHNTADIIDWELQSDMAVPYQFSLYNIKLDGLLFFILKYIKRRFINWRQELCRRQSIDDDIFLLKRSPSASKYLQRMSDLMGLPFKNIYSKGEYVYNSRIIRYSYIASKIDAIGLGKGAVWIDVGSYYGGLQKIFFDKNRSLRVVLVDFYHQLLRSYVVLKTSFPDQNFILPDDISPNLDVRALPEGTFVFLPIEKFHSISVSADLFTNFFSFGEMTDKVFDDYLGSPNFRNSKQVLMANRFVSSPNTAERIYDSNKDISHYMRHFQESRFRIQSFDIFPIHYYSLYLMPIFGNNRRPRAVSSPYFEISLIRDSD